MKNIYVCSEHEKIFKKQSPLFKIKKTCFVKTLEKLKKQKFKKLKKFSPRIFLLSLLLLMMTKARTFLYFS